MGRSFETGRGFESKKLLKCYRKAVILTIPDAEKVWWEKRPWRSRNERKRIRGRRTPQRGEVMKRTKQRGQMSESMAMAAV